MKQTPRAGAMAEMDFIVEDRHAIAFGAPVPPLLSTPSLIWQLEHAAIKALGPFLSPGEISLGASVQLEHFAPSRVGASVSCMARIVRAEGHRILFQLEAHQGGKTIARGLHHRTIVNADAFLRSP